MESSRQFWARVTYWLLFLFVPSALVYFFFGGMAIGFCLGIFFALVLLGEHGFRHWKRLWRVG